VKERLTVKEMSEICNCTPQTIRNWINDYELSMKEKFSYTVNATEKLGHSHGRVLNGPMIVNYSI
jgi:transcriptional antiterminator